MERALVHIGLFQTIGAVLSGIGTLLLGVAGMANRQRLIDFFRSRNDLADERDRALSRAEAAEKRAENWEGASEGADKILQRVKALEEHTRERFDAMVAFTTEVFDFAVYLQRLLAASNIRVEREMPAIPPILADKFPTERVEG